MLTLFALCLPWASNCNFISNTTFCKSFPFWWSSLVLFLVFIYTYAPRNPFSMSFIIHKGKTDAISTIRARHVNMGRPIILLGTKSIPIKPNLGSKALTRKQFSECDKCTMVYTICKKMLKWRAKEKSARQQEGHNNPCSQTCATKRIFSNNIRKSVEQTWKMNGLNRSQRENLRHYARRSKS